MNIRTRLFAGLRLSSKGSFTLLAVFWSALVCSQDIVDPTRPAMANKAHGENVIEENVTPTLQMVLIGKSRKYAIIDGEIVKSGETYNGSRLVAIEPGWVKLRNDDNIQTLKMLPAIKKTVKTHNAPATKNRRVKN